MSQESQSDDLQSTILDQRDAIPRRGWSHPSKKAPDHPNGHRDGLHIQWSSNLAKGDRLGQIWRGDVTKLQLCRDALSVGIVLGIDIAREGICDCGCS